MVASLWSVWIYKNPKQGNRGNFPPYCTTVEDSQNYSSVWFNSFRIAKTCFWTSGRSNDWKHEKFEAVCQYPYCLLPFAILFYSLWWNMGNGGRNPMSFVARPRLLTKKISRYDSQVLQVLRKKNKVVSCWIPKRSQVPNLVRVVFFRGTSGW